MRENKAVVEQKCEQIIDTLIAIGTEGTNILLKHEHLGLVQGVGTFTASISIINTAARRSISII